jgi:hypothetical protein
MIRWVREIDLRDNLTLARAVSPMTESKFVLSGPGDWGLDVYTTVMPNQSPKQLDRSFPKRAAFQIQVYKFSGEMKSEITTASEEAKSRNRLSKTTGYLQFSSHFPKIDTGYMESTEIRGSAADIS